MYFHFLFKTKYYQYNTHLEFIIQDFRKETDKIEKDMPNDTYLSNNMNNIYQLIYRIKMNFERYRIGKEVNKAKNNIKFTKGTYYYLLSNGFKRSKNKSPTMKDMFFKIPTYIQVKII